MNVGAELASARRNLGLSIEEVSATTKISVERLSAIEEMDAERLPTLIYLKGFLRAYAAEVQLDPDDVAQRYLAELDVVGPLDIGPPVRSPAVPADEPVVPPSEPIVPTREPVVPASAVTLRASTPEPAPPVAEPAPRLSQPRYFEAYGVADTPTDEAPRRSSTRWTPLVLLLPVAVFAGWMLSENYDAIMARLSRPTAVDSDARPDDRPGATDAREGTTQELATPAAGAGSDAPGEPTEDRPVRAADRSSATTSRPDTRATTTTAESGRATEPTDSGRGTQPTTAAPSMPAAAAGPAADSDRSTPAAAERAKQLELERAKQADAARAGRSEETDARVAEREADTDRAVEKKPPVRPASDLSGRWTLTNRVESSSYAPYTGMNVGFHLQLQQDGNRVTGAGQKWMENGRPLPPGSRTPISVEGTLTGNRLELTFTERGTRRTSAGTFVMTIAADGTMQGTFASDAANAQGTSLARRAEPPRQ